MSVTREQFEAAAKRVMETAPAGLSKEQFLDLIHREITAPSTPTAADMLTGKMGRDSGAVEHEPDSFWPGFLNQLKKEFVTGTRGEESLIDRNRPLAHPQSVGDMSGLLLPATSGAQVRGFIGAGKNLVKGAAEGAADREGLKKIPAVLKGMLNVATDTVSGRDRAWQKLPLDQQMGDLPITGTTEARAARPPVSSAPPNPNDIPLWKQMESLPESGPTPQRGSQAPPVQVGQKPAGPAPRLVGKAPSVEDEIQKILEESLGSGEPAPTSTMPPEISTTGAGPSKQSGKFGKSGNKGQAGGYSSGRPAISEEGYDNLVESAPEPDVEDVIGHAPEVGSGGLSPGPEDAGNSASSSVEAAPTASKPVLNVNELAQMMRRMYGSRDAGRMLYGSSLPPAERGASITRLAPGPSQIPLVAEERINAAEGRGDNLLMELLQSLGIKGQP